MTDLSQWGLIVTTFVVLFGLVIGVLTFVSAQTKVALDKAESNYSLHEVKIAALHDQIDQKIERVSITESKARHDMTNSLTAQLLKLEGQVARVADQAVKKEDLSRVERTLEALVMKIGSTDVITQKVDDLSRRFDKFMDGHEQRNRS